VVSSILLGDIGGTTARFALLRGAHLGPIMRLPVATYGSPADAIAGFIAKSQSPPPPAAVLGVAGPVEDDRCRIVNSGWLIDARELREAFGFQAVRVINDFEALAWSLPFLSGEDVRPLGGGESVPDQPAVVIGPGTGLGMAAFIPRASDPFVVATEGGHATLPTATRREHAVIERLRGRFDHVSAERALSGGGLENLYHAIAALENAAVPGRTAAEITQHACDGTCTICEAATDMFCALLGGVAGDLALMFRARSGVFVAGGIIPQIVDLLANSAFRERFVAKGRFRSYLEAIPTGVIMREDAAFLGLRGLALRLARA
jgi:glucokinase